MTDLTSIFEKLSSLDVNEHKERKGNFDYLSWTWAWDYFKKNCPDATYKVIAAPSGSLYHSCGDTALVMTKVTANGESHEMWLAVKDNKHQAIVNPSSTDVSNTLMRCLVKNLAMFGLGLYIYAGEDLPEESAEDIAEKNKAAQAAEDALVDKMVAKLDDMKEWSAVNDCQEASQGWIKGQPPHVAQRLRDVFTDRLESLAKLEAA